MRLIRHVHACFWYRWNQEFILYTLPLIPFFIITRVLIGREIKRGDRLTLSRPITAPLSKLFPRPATGRHVFSLPADYFRIKNFKTFLSFFCFIYVLFSFCCVMCDGNKKEKYIDCYPKRKFQINHHMNEKNRKI